MPYTRSKRAQRLHRVEKIFRTHREMSTITDNQEIVSTHPIGEAYDNIAELYTEMFSGQMDESPFERAVVGLFADIVRSLPGNVVDVGCGPGHVTNYLAGLGLKARGIDQSQAFVNIASNAYPEIQFDLGDMASLDATDNSLAGLLCKSSTIHMPPDELGGIFEEFARVLLADGLLLVTFFGTNHPSEHGLAFEHQVATAYQCDRDAIGSLLAASGFVEVSRHQRQARPEERRQFPQSAVLVQKSAGKT